MSPVRVGATGSDPAAIVAPARSSKAHSVGTEAKTGSREVLALRLRAGLFTGAGPALAKAPNIVESMRRGASDFLLKPFELEELDLALRNALGVRGATAICPTCNGAGRV